MSCRISASPLNPCPDLELRIPPLFSTPPLRCLSVLSLLLFPMQCPPISVGYLAPPPVLSPSWAQSESRESLSSYIPFPASSLPLYRSPINFLFFSSFLSESSTFSDDHSDLMLPYLFPVLTSPSPSRRFLTPKTPSPFSK